MVISPEDGRSTLIETPSRNRLFSEPPLLIKEILTWCHRKPYLLSTSSYLFRVSLRYVTSGAGIPQKPKRPLGKYMIFSQEKHPQVRAKNPDLSFTETAKEIARLWRELPDEEKQSYTTQAKEYMENYNEEIAIFKASLTEEDVKMIAQHKQQKKLMNVNKKNRQVSFLN